MKLRRGFRKEAEEYALEFRAELNIAPDGPLCPFALADHLAVPILKLSELAGLEARFVKGASEVGFSATTIFDGTFKTIIHNDTQHLYRQNSNLMHEIAHILLGHPPRPPLTSDGCRNFDSGHEKEASELGFTLLIPRGVALRVVEMRMPLDLACIEYGVSSSLLGYRIRITNAQGWARNRRAYSRAAE